MTQSAVSAGLATGLREDALHYNYRSNNTLEPYLVNLWELRRDRANEAANFIEQHTRATTPSEPT